MYRPQTARAPAVLKEMRTAEPLAGSRRRRRFARAGLIFEAAFVTHPRVDCAATTCVHGRERDSWPHGTRRRSTRPAHSEILARARNIRDDRKKPRDVFLLRDHCAGSAAAGRCGLAFLRHVGSRCLPLPPLPFRLGMLSASFNVSAAFLLALGCLPAAQLLPAFGFLAIALVVPPSLKSPAAVFAKTRSPSQPPTPGRRPAFVAMLNLSHGR